MGRAEYFPLLKLGNLLRTASSNQAKKIGPGEEFRASIMSSVHTDLRTKILPKKEEPCNFSPRLAQDNKTYPQCHPELLGKKT